METEITVQVVQGDGGYFIARAIGYPGVSSFGRSQEQAIERIKHSWMVMERYNASQNTNDTRRFSANAHATEINLPLQFA